MIVFKKFGKTIKIYDNHWKKLRARYDPKNATLNAEHECYEIKRTCPFCNLYLNKDCIGCPFEVFEKYGCFEFFELVFKWEVIFETDSMAEVYWEEENDKKARKQLNRLQRMMDKIEASQGDKDVTK